MCKKTPLLSLIIATILFGNLLPVKADVINPDWFTKKCQPGETAVSCSFDYSKPFSDRTNDAECKKYESDQNYYELVGRGSTWGGEIRFCKKVSTAEPEPKVNPTQSTSSDSQQEKINPTSTPPQPDPMANYTWPIGLGIGIVVAASIFLLLKLKKQGVSN